MAAIETPSNADYHDSVQAEVIAADLTLQLSEIHLPSTTDFAAIATEQANDAELQNLISGTVPDSLNLQSMQITPELSLFCDVQGSSLQH